VVRPAILENSKEIQKAQGRMMRLKGIPWLRAIGQTTLTVTVSVFGSLL